MAIRTRRETKTKLDLSKPVDTDSIPLNEGECFGKEWDMGTKECQYCADNEVCGLLMSNVVNKKVTELESKEEFLDLTDFTLVKIKELEEKCLGYTTQQLVDTITKTARATDEVAVIEFIKNWIRNSDKVKIKEGVLCQR